MSFPSDRLPVTDRPRKEYLTLVLVRVEGTENAFPIDDIANSITHGTECKTFPGYRVHDMSHGDYIATAINSSKEFPS